MRHLRLAFVVLAAAGLAPDEIRAGVARVSYLPVLTAHPTEARRRTLDAYAAALKSPGDR